MKQKLLAFVAAALIFASCSDDTKTASTTESNAATTKEEEKKPAEWIPIDSNMMNKVWAESMTVGEQHKMLAKASGTWTGEVTMWMANGAPPQTSTSTSVSKMIYNDLYQQTNHSGTMMGMPFEGTSTMGYDNLKKEFFSTWIDNMGSGILVMTGQLDGSGKKINLSGNTKCMNGQDATMREVFTFVDDDHHLLEMYAPDPATGKEYKNMEIKYTRKK
jgi:hypothetical protein